jgi:cation diffusion facilitator family transporter
MASDTTRPADIGKGETTPVESRQRTVLISLCFDILIWIPEAIAAFFTGSVTLFADVMKCGNEILATFFAYLVIRKMNKAGKFSYDFGMGKFETITRITTGAVMLVSLFIILFFTFMRLLHPEPLESEGALLIIALMFTVTVVDTYQWRKNYRIARRDPSPIMESQWRLRRAKSFADISVLLALLLSFGLAGYPGIEYIDPIVSFVIVGFLLVAGYKEISTSLPDLVDKTLEEEYQILILRELTTHYEKFDAFHCVRSRRSGSHVYIELSLGFDPEQKMGDVQDFIDSLKISVEKMIPGSIVSIVPTSGRCGSDDQPGLSP